MKRTLWAVTALLVSVVGSGAVTVKQGGGGDFTTIQAAINSGATIITIIDSSTYVEDLIIGDPLTNGPAVTLTSTSTGPNRPVITPAAGNVYVNTARSDQQAGFGVLANNSVVSNLILEANPDTTPKTSGAMMVMADNVRIENCLFRIASGTTATLGWSSPLLFWSQEGESGIPATNGRDCNGSLVRNCEFIGMAPDAVPVEPTGFGTNALGIADGSGGYLLARSAGLGTGQSSGHGRIDHRSDGRDVFITYEGCYFHHSRDYGIFPSNFGIGEGSINLVIKKCWFDSSAKFHIRGRGCNVMVEDSVFTRACQARNGDGENSAVAVNRADGHDPVLSVKNCLFVNDGAANAQRAFYGGANNADSSGLAAIDHCTFVDCLTGVGAGAGGSAAAAMLSVSNSIFHQIGDNVVPSVHASGYTLTNGSPDLVGGLYPAWTNGLVNFQAPHVWSAVFNRYALDDGSLVIITNCMVGSIDTEDTRTWDDALTSGVVLGCRLFAGYDTDFVGITNVTRATPVFENTDPAAPNAFQLAAGSPGQGLGTDLAPVLSPKLSFSQAGNQITISWTQPLWMTGYALKSTSSLSSPSWAPVAGVSNFAVNYTVTVTIGAGNQFFAILKQ